MERLTRFLPRHVLRVLLLLGFCSAVSAAPSDDFRSGVEAFGKQEFAAALAYFIAARNGGMSAPTLHYNLGATYFRLGRLDESAEEFRLLSRDPDWGALAHYNLGLIAETRGRQGEAADHFQTAFDRSSNAKLRALAAAKIETVLPTTALAEGGWDGLLSVATGYDDNVLLGNDREVVSASNQDDFFTDLSAIAGTYVAGNLNEGWYLNLSGYYRGYWELDDFNFGVGYADVTYGHLFENWYIQAGPRVETQVTGDDYFSTIGSLRLQVLRPVGAWILRIRTDYAYHEAASQYEYITGTQLRAGFDITRRFPRTRVRIAYEFEQNDRQDLTSGGEFFSYSPQRHAVSAEIRQRLVDRVRVEGRIEYRGSNYKHPNTQLDGATSVSATRNDDRLTGSARLSYAVIDVGTFFLDYQYADNDSSFEEYSYNSGQVSIGFDYLF